MYIIAAWSIFVITITAVAIVIMYIIIVEVRVIFSLLVVLVLVIGYDRPARSVLSWAITWSSAAVGAWLAVNVVFIIIVPVVAMASVSAWISGFVAMASVVAGVSMVVVLVILRRSEVVAELAAISPVAGSSFEVGALYVVAVASSLTSFSVFPFKFFALFS